MGKKMGILMGKKWGCIPIFPTLAVLSVLTTHGAEARKSLILLRIYPPK
jgi:hypothetical protein